MLVSSTISALSGQQALTLALNLVYSVLIGIYTLEKIHKAQRELLRLLLPNSHYYGKPPVEGIGLCTLTQASDRTESLYIYISDIIHSKLKFTSK